MDDGLSVGDADIMDQLDRLHADATAALDAVALSAPSSPAEPDDMNGPIVLANGMWANRWHAVWRVTEDRDGDRDKPAHFVALRLDDCRRWAGAQLRNSKP